MYFLEKNYKRKKTGGIKLIALHMWVYNGLCILHGTGIGENRSEIGSE